MQKISVKTVVDEHKVYNLKGNLIGVIYPHLCGDYWVYEYHAPHSEQQIKEVLDFGKNVLGGEVKL